VSKKNAAQGHVTHPPRSPQKVAIAKTDRVNYTTMEDIPEGEQVLTGMFSLKGHPIVVLFYSGATRNFISKARTKNYRLTVTHLSTPYMISTPGGKMVTQYLAKNTPLNLVGKVYKTGLIILDGQWNNVILGMSWMKEFKALLDIVARTMTLLLALCTWSLQLIAVLSYNFHHQPLQLQHFIIQLLKISRTSLWPASFLMSFQKTC
jgi:hypothetical protein